MQPAIEVRGVGKRFRLSRTVNRTLKGAALELVRGRPSRKQFWALRGIDFDVAPGETLGIIGANGAGKSTLLSVIAGTLSPTEGNVQARGKVASLLELGAGFHPDLSGRENVFLYGAIMGLGRRQMEERFEKIVAFAELADFIDQPVKFYSSGMYVRLGFAVAVELDPDILLVDEVLAVGDARFQRRCLDRMTAFREAGKTMLLISHDLGTIQAVSDRILLLEKGEIKELGEPDRIVEEYAQAAAAHAEVDAALRKEWGSREIEVKRVALLDREGRPCTAFEWGDPLTMEIDYEAHMSIEKPVFGFAVADVRGETLFGTNTDLEGAPMPPVSGCGTVRMDIPSLHLHPGDYVLSVALHSHDLHTNYHRLDHCFPMVVTGEKVFDGPCYQPCRWTF